MLPGNMRQPALLILLCFTSLVSGTNPGMIGLLTSKGLYAVSSAFVQMVQEKVTKLNIPDLSGTTSAAGIRVDYNIKNIKIESFKLPTPETNFLPGVGVALSLYPISFQVTGSWSVHYLTIFSGGGDFQVYSSSFFLKLAVGVTSTDDGYPRMWLDKCSSGVNDVDVQIWGGTSWFYSMFLGPIKDTVKHVLNAQICDKLQPIIKQVNQKLHNLPVSYKVDKYSEFEYSIISPPNIDDNSIEVDSKGEFYYIGHHQEAPFQPQSFSLPHINDYMLYLGISEFSLNSAAFVYYTANLLKITIDDDKIPPSSPIRLNTKSLAAFLPGVDKLYPNMLVEISVSAEKQPLLTLQMDKIMTQAALLTQISAVLPNASLAPICIVEAHVNISGKPSVVNNNLTGSMTLNGLSLSLVKSYIGEIDVHKLENIMSLMGKLVVIPKVNDYFLLHPEYCMKNY
ncbi:bactericidal permeability-increasing protein-like [Protopterus annectens]|uniref:bactericidal permeability-increasing protein-like n=1 Tax=Protopterus annectens TaxID=7888 RepID=UPI001CFBAD62|nr:bactericidal permeability-increasing protein-like [Protopterus annectens]